MEKTRDLSPVAGSDVRSLSSTSTGSQSSDKRSLKNGVESQSSLLSLLLEAINETTAEKKAQCKEISELLSLLDIDPSLKSMSKDIQNMWAKASAIMRAEGLSSMDEVALTLHMQRKKREAMKKAREERKLKSRFNDLQTRQTEVLEKNNRAQESVDSLQKVIDDESNNNEQHVNRMVNAVKLNDYKEIIEKTEETLNKMGANDYFPEKILEKYKTYLQLQEELAEIEESLKKYHDLPPNLSEARVKLAEKEKYLKDLEHAIFEKMK